MVVRYLSWPSTSPWVDDPGCILINLLPQPMLRCLRQLDLKVLDYSTRSRSTAHLDVPDQHISLIRICIKKRIKSCFFFFFVNTTHTSPQCRCLNLVMRWDTSSVMFPEILGCFRSCNIRHPPSGIPARADQTPTFVLAALAHISDLLIQIHPEALSAASVVDLMALLFAAPMILHLLAQQAFLPLLQHSSMSSWYLNHLCSLASSTPSSQGTVNSNRRTCLEEIDVNTTSGLKEADVAAQVGSQFPV